MKFWTRLFGKKEEKIKLGVIFHNAGVKNLESIKLKITRDDKSNTKLQKELLSKMTKASEIINDAQLKQTPFGIASRGTGRVNEKGEIEDFNVLSYDLVMNPSFKCAMMGIKPKSKFRQWFADIWDKLKMSWLRFKNRIQEWWAN